MILALAVEEATDSCDPTDQVIQGRRDLAGWFPLCNEIDSCSLFPDQENTAGKFRTRPTDHRQVKSPPGDQPVTHDGGLRSNAK